MNIRSGRVALFGASIVMTVGSLIVAAPASAAEDAVGRLRAEQVEMATHGDAVAQADVERIDALTVAERGRLQRFLVSGFEEPEATEASGTMARVAADNSDVLWITESDDNQSSRVGSRSVSGTQTMTFLGITLTQVKTWGNYTVEAPKVLRVTDWGTQVVKNFQPLTQVTASKQSAVISGGNVTFKGTVVVNRGPAPGLGGNWSTHSGYHTVKANYVGTVVSNSWT